MTKLLNLDEVAAKAERVLTYQGERYPMKTMTVQEFIDFTLEAEEAVKAEAQKAEAAETGEVESEKSAAVKIVQSFVTMVTTSFPTFPEEKARKLSLEQLRAIIEFARGDLDDEAAEDGKK